MKEVILLSAPIKTRSGYGDHARDLAYAIITHLSDKYRLMILPTAWGNTPWTGLDLSTEKGKSIQDCIVSTPPPYQPDVFMQVTIPNEFQPIGKYNIGVTAGIETDLAAPDWVEGCNRMNMVITTSEHALKVLQESRFDAHEKTTDKLAYTLHLQSNVKTHVLFEGYDSEVFTDDIDLNDSQYDDMRQYLNNIPEDFCYLFVGHWLQGDLGQDRKDVGMMIKTFVEAFKNKPASTRPALIVKTGAGNSGIIDRMAIKSKIESILKGYGVVPSVYLLHGEISESEMNYLYRHPRVKAMVSFTKGEGFGRPLLEFATTGKPVIVSKWSGQLDFLSPQSTIFLSGNLTPVHPSAANDWILKEANWFTVDYLAAQKTLQSVYDRYKDYHKISISQKKYLKERYTLEHMAEKLRDILLTLPVSFTNVEVMPSVTPTFQIPKLNKL